MIATMDRHALTTPIALYCFMMATIGRNADRFMIATIDGHAIVTPIAL
jgi:hypothetical protein